MCVYLYSFTHKLFSYCCYYFIDSFKERGACYALQMLPYEKKISGVVTASLGNHALGLSFHGKKMGIPVTVVMPTNASITKIQACQNFGANVIVQGTNMKESKRIALQIANDEKLTFIDG